MKLKKPKPFKDRLEPFSAKQIADAIGCALPTAYDWRSGRRVPPAFLHDKFLQDIEAHCGEVAK